MRLIAGGQSVGKAYFSLKCPACGASVVIPEIAIDKGAKLVHLVRPEVALKHSFQMTGCWCQPRILLGYEAGGFGVVLHVDEEELQ